MVGKTARWLLVPLVVLALAGCPKQGSETTSAPAGGPPGPPGGPGASAPPSGAAMPPPGSAPKATPVSGSDAVMMGKVKNALMVKKVNLAKLRVDAKDGTVTLSGSVPTAAQKTQAEQAAKATAGVKSVKNNLTVSTGS